MSGGSLNYFYCSLESHIGDFGDKELDELVKDLADLFHDREWFLSGDTGEGHWREARDNFKAKWFTEHGRQDRIEQYLKEIHDEVLDSFGMMTDICKNCKHFRCKSDYGSCDLDKTYKMHRSNKCDKGAFVAKDGAVDCKLQTTEKKGNKDA